MLCYHDKTWCPFYKECGQGDGCSRALTDEVKEDASKCWNGRGLPIMEFASKPECFKEVKNED